jgi:DNA-binding SARP family transcriptional activator
MRLLGHFELRIAGQTVDLSVIRPRVRTLLRFLSMHVDTPVHREAIVEALWPEAEPTAAARNLHVAVASLRRVLEPGASRGGFRLVRREGDAYQLSLPPGSHIDLVGFERAVAEAQAADARHEPRTPNAMWTGARPLPGGELLPEEGAPLGGGQARFLPDGSADGTTRKRRCSGARRKMAAAALQPRRH